LRARPRASESIIVRHVLPPEQVDTRQRALSSPGSANFPMRHRPNVPVVNNPPSQRIKSEKWWNAFWREPDKMDR
jgi:hypothetical protein